MRMVRIIILVPLFTDRELNPNSLIISFFEFFESGIGIISIRKY